MLPDQIRDLWDRYYEIVDPDSDRVETEDQVAQLKALIAEAPYQRKDQTEFVEGFWPYNDETCFVMISLFLESGECAMCDADQPDVDRDSNRLDKLRWAKIRELLTTDELAALKRCSEAADQVADACESDGDETTADQIWSDVHVLQQITDYRIDTSGFVCVDCQVNTSEINEYYMVTDEVWAKTKMAPHDGMLCIGCIETRLGRQLAPADFPDYPVNDERFCGQSDRLKSRITCLEVAA